MEYFVLVARCFIGEILLVSAGTKLRDPWGLAESLVELRLVRGRLRRHAAVTVIAVELALTGLIAWPSTAPAGLAAATELLITFTTVAFLADGKSWLCRCFG